ncbi:MAG: TIGR02391 family protein [Deltaproteobacteria bacterium]|nr:TIGR02391 family protein [Deltaproteobacteria bacterium]
MLRIIGHGTTGGLVWEPMGDDADGQPGVVIAFPFPGAPGRRKAIRLVEKELLTAGVNWFTVRSRLWHVDRDLLRAAFQLPAEFDVWAKGVVVLEPNYDQHQGGVGRFPTTTGIVELIVEPAQTVLACESADVRSRIFDERELHPAVGQVARALFVNGHYRQAVLDTSIALVGTVKGRSGQADLDGVKLIGKVFCGDAPLLRFYRGSARACEDEQQGLGHLFMGVVQALRNPPAHDVALGRSLPDALEALALLSMLFRHLDSARPARDEAAP